MKDRYHCTGCAACEAVCPTGALEMKADAEHFLQPVIDYSKCINCKLCEKTCQKSFVQNHIIESYAVQFHDEMILRSSTSGGAITALSNVILKRGGIIYAGTYSISEGCKWIRIDNTDNLSEIRGSKYLQIGLRGSDYKKIKKELTQRQVLFIGTPCQVDGIRKALSEREKNNLFVVDIICGGVISEQIERLYEKYTEKTSNKKLSKRVFRGKKNGLWNRIYCSENHFSDGTFDIHLGGEDLYTRAFISERLLRESCYLCEYASLNRVGDITVGDCWGIEKETFEFPKKEMGVSLVLVNTEKGRELFNEVSNTVALPLQNKAPIIDNKPLHKCTKRHKMRDFSYRLYDVFPFIKATNIISYRYSIKRLLGRR